jgi:hypothetical protein
MQKFGTYMADIMPVMQAEIIKASAKLNRSQPNQSPRKGRDADSFGIVGRLCQTLSSLGVEVKLVWPVF